VLLLAVLLLLALALLLLLLKAQVLQPAAMVEECRERKRCYQGLDSLLLVLVLLLLLLCMCCHDHQQQEGKRVQLLQWLARCCRRRSRGSLRLHGCCPLLPLHPHAGHARAGSGPRLAAWDLQRGCLWCCLLGARQRG